MRISDWSSDVWLFRSRRRGDCAIGSPAIPVRGGGGAGAFHWPHCASAAGLLRVEGGREASLRSGAGRRGGGDENTVRGDPQAFHSLRPSRRTRKERHPDGLRSEEHTSELQSLMRISYAVFCLKKKKQKKNTTNTKYSKTTDRRQNMEQYE